MKLEEIGFYTLCDDRARNASVDSPLWRCEILITRKCNFRCFYCRSIGEELSPKEVVNVVSLWKSMGLKNIRFSGGEPTQNLSSLIAGIKASKDCERIAISTNGSADWNVYKYLIKLGVNDFSISLDACCASDGDRIAGREGTWYKVINNIKKIVDNNIYITVGIVVLPETENLLKDTIIFADSLGVNDIRPIPAAQWKNKLQVPFLDKYPILKYRSRSKLFRGNPAKKCALVLDDMAVMGNKHYPCIIYLREGGNAIGEINKDMRQDRLRWYENHNPKKDKICSSQCLDVCRDYNNKYISLHSKPNPHSK